MSTLYNPIHECQTVEALEVWVQLVVDPLWHAARVEELIGVRQAQGVEAGTCHVVEHVLPVANPEAMGGKATGLQAKPVDAGERDLAARRIHQLTMQGAEESHAMTMLAMRGGFLRNRNRDYLRYSNSSSSSSRCTGR